MTISKAAIGADNKISLDCPRCGQHIQVPLDRVGHKYHCRFKCTCSYVFVAEIEFRERFRKPVDLPGTYETSGANTPAGSPTGNCRIIDISRSGIAFLKTDEGRLAPEDVVLLRFNLDDARGSEVSQECAVIHVKDNFVGCRMLSENSGLSFYLLE